MLKITTCFIDASAWIAICDKSDPHHLDAQNFLRKLLDSNTRFVTNNLAVDEALEVIKRKLGNQEAQRLSTIIDESVLTINLRMDWISRRIRKNAINQFLRSKKDDVQPRHFMINETIKRKKVDSVFTFDPILTHFGTPTVPQQL